MEGYGDTEKYGRKRKEKVIRPIRKAEVRKRKEKVRRPRRRQKVEREWKK